MAAVAVGRFVLEVGSPSGTSISRAAEPAGGDPSRLARELDEAREERKRKRSPVQPFAEGVDVLEEATGKAEKAVQLFRALAEGRALEPDQLKQEIDLLLSFLGQLEGNRYWEEAVRLARALADLVALAGRWRALAESLEIGLAAARESGDKAAEAWAEHELGTFELAAGRVPSAERRLRRARDTRDGLGDRQGATATERNLRVLCEQLREMLRDGALVERGALRRRWVLVGAVATLLFAGGAGAGAIVAGDDQPEDEAASPGISVRVPAQGARYQTGETVIADYACVVDSGATTLRSCKGSVPDGEPVDTSEGAHTFTVTATDVDGHQVSERVAYTAGDALPPDRTKPTIRIVSPLASAVLGARRVLADYSCEDEPGGSGITSCRGSVRDGAAIDNTPGAHTFTVTARDGAGNSTEKTVTYTVDSIQPSITITSPTGGEPYFEGDSVVAEYSCVDEGGSGIARCEGPVPSGNEIPTDETGLFDFTVTAADRAGNETSRSVSYEINPDID